MKRSFFIIKIFFLSVGFAYSTEQIPDILIVNNDTICLKSFPLQQLNFEKAPFIYGHIKGDYITYPHTACWRGYQAIWQVIDNKLFLIEVIKIDSTQEKLDLMQYFENNNYTPKVENGKIFADWVAANFEPYSHWHKNYNCLFISHKPKKSKILIRFENGIMIENKWKRKNK